MLKEKPPVVMDPHVRDPPPWPPPETGPNTGENGAAALKATNNGGGGLTAPRSPNLMCQSFL